ncbi:hypothetical protein ACINK0_14920 [Deinococcus sp. VB343]|uniref:hypothetical protein n=1 Tax=Deinococcus sp. VB343 TaxID=3385567 RepID=UPI0039C96251
MQTKQDSGWVDIDLPGPLWVVLTNRNYAVFGALAGVRNSYGLPLIREVRGWPDGEVTPDGWAATWYDLQELEAHDWLGGAWTQPVDVYTRDGWGKQPLHERTGHFREGLGGCTACAAAHGVRLIGVGGRVCPSPPSSWGSPSSMTGGT